MRCPVCKADNALDPACRRCKADLALLVQVETQRGQKAYVPVKLNKG